MGAIAEQKFELMCLERDIPVFKPVIDIYGIDFIIKKKNKLLKLQVKSTMKKDVRRHSYKISVARGHNSRMYKKGSFDYLVVYIFEIHQWYIIPEKEINAKCIRINPERSASKFNQYKERWDYLI